MNLEVVSSAASGLLRATHVLEFAVDAVHDEPWRPAHAGYRVRERRVEARVVTVIKGIVREPEGARVTLTLAQYGYASDVVLDALPGVWSSVDLAAGRHLIMLANHRGEGASLVALVADGVCERVVDASGLGPEVSLYVAAERGAWPLARVVEQARAMAPSLHDLFVDYLWARHGTDSLRDASVRRALLGLLVEETLSNTARATMLLRADDLAGAPEVGADYLDDLSATLFELLTIAAARAQHETLVANTLPMLLRMGPGSRDPERVFARDPSLRARCRAALHAMPPTADPRMLLEWLR